MANPKGGPGAKGKYKKEFDKQAYKLCLLGADDKKLADFFEVTEKTVNNWKKSHPSFLQSLKDGKENADAAIASSLYHRALGYSHEEEKVFNNQGEIVTHKTTKHYAPDPTSAIFWLKNRQPDKWRDKQHVEHSGEIGKMTDEELDRRIQELTNAARDPE